MNCSYIAVYLPDLQIEEDDLQNMTLLEIEKVLQQNRRSLKEFPSLPFPKGYISNVNGNRLIFAELDYDVEELKKQYEHGYNSFTGKFINQAL